jgi:hypothetical protein
VDTMAQWAVLVAGRRVAQARAALAMALESAKGPADIRRAEKEYRRAHRALDRAQTTLAMSRLLAAPLAS